MKKAKTIAKFSQAVATLERVLGMQAAPELWQAAVIQHFEFCFELLWKTLQHFATEQSRDVRGPRDAFSEAVVLGIINDDPVWREILADRNLSVHTYDEQLALALSARIQQKYVHVFRKLVDRIAVLEARAF